MASIVFSRVHQRPRFALREGRKLAQLASNTPHGYDVDLVGEGQGLRTEAKDGPLADRLPQTAKRRE